MAWVGLGKGPRLLAVVGVLAVGACTEDGPAKGGALVEVTGRVFSLDKESPLTGAQISGPGHSKAKTTQDGSFAIVLDSSKPGSLTAVSEKTAPVSKPAPSTQAHVELHAKEFDAQQEIDVVAGGELKTKDGAGLSLGKGQLESKASSAKDKAQISVAVPDTKQASGLGSLPGNFDAKKGGKAGKIATESAVYVSVKQGADELSLKGGAKAKLSLKGAVMQQKASDLTLYRFDEASGTWLDVGQVQSGTDAGGLATYSGDVDGFGWFAVGEFYDALSCIHGCIAGEAAGTRVIATGVDHPSQSATFTDADGCFTLQVKAAAKFSVSAQAKGRASAGSFVMTGSGPACSSLDSLVLAAADPSCALGLNLCAAGCSDLDSDPRNCGACGTPCASDEACLVGHCVGPGEVIGSDGGVTDGGVGVDPLDGGTPNDGGTTSPDAASACGACGSANTVVGPFTLAGCCSFKGECGYVSDPLLIELGFSYDCIERDQLGASTSACPAFAHEGANGQLDMPGCCRDDNTCGYDTSAADYTSFQPAPDGGAGPNNLPTPLGLGCVRADQVVPGAVGRSCAGSAGDADGDGIPNNLDSCPFTADGGSDVDGDGVADACDNCPSDFNLDQSDKDQDKTGDVCDADIDGDGVLNASDNCPDAPNVNQSNMDNDAFGDMCDVCPYDPLASQTDTDRDGAGDDCDNCPYEPNPDQLDVDPANGHGDVCEIF
ncbi:MAG: thrombospondin type 3 repeat-containing protein [Myxococcales bacterium]